MCYIHLEEASYEPPLLTPPSKHRPDTFHRFSKLPIELRLTIWELASESESRVVEVVYCGNEEKWVCPKESYFSYFHNYWHSGILQANKESRRLYQKHWFPFFPRSAAQIPCFPSCEHTLAITWGDQQTYFNPKVDTLYLSYHGDSCTPHLENQIFDKLFERHGDLRKDIRYVCVEATGWDDIVNIADDRAGSPYMKLRASPQRFFPDIKQFIVVVSDMFDKDPEILSSGFVEEHWPGFRPDGPIELREPCKALWNHSVSENVREYFEHHKREHADAGNPPWAIKAISRGGRRGIRYWDMHDELYME